MDARELRIGNKVECFGVREIIELSRRECRFSDDDGASIGTIKPIELTEDWLDLKTELIKINSKLGVTFLMNQYYEVLYYEGLGLWKVICDKRILTEIKYVHQLQNLYFALNGEELKIK